jgi:hypothetical protein
MSLGPCRSAPWAGFPRRNDAMRDEGPYRPAPWVGRVIEGRERRSRGASEFPPHGRATALILLRMHSKRHVVPRLLPLIASPGSSFALPSLT